MGEVGVVSIETYATCVEIEVHLIAFEYSTFFFFPPVHVLSGFNVLCGSLRVGSVFMLRLDGWAG